MTEPATSICDPNPNPLAPTGSDVAQFLAKIATGRVQSRDAQR